MTTDAQNHNEDHTASVSIAPLDPNTLNMLGGYVWVVDIIERSVLWRNQTAQKRRIEFTIDDPKSDHIARYLATKHQMKARWTAQSAAGPVLLVGHMRRVNRPDGTWIVLIEAATDEGNELNDRAILAVEAIDLTGGIISIIHHNGQLVFQNAAADQAFGPLPDSNEDPMFYQSRFQDPEDWFDIKTMLRDADHFELELEVDTVKGPVWHGIFAQKITHPLSFVPAIIIQETNITRRREIEDALSESERRYRALVDGSDMGVWQLDCDYNVTHLNAYLTSQLGPRKSDQAYKNPIFSLVSTNSAERIKQMLETIAKDPDLEISPIEIELVDMNNQAHTYLLNSTPLVDSQNQVTSFLGSLINISQRQRLEQASAWRNQIMATILDSLPLELHIKDGDGIYRMHNQQAAKSHGLPAEELIGKTDFDIYSEEIARRSRQDDLEIYIRRQNIWREEMIQTAHGNRRYYRGKSIIEAEDGEDYIMGFDLDMAEIGRLEEDIEQKGMIIKSAFDENPNPNIIFDMSGHVAHANKAAGDMIGVDQFELPKLGRILALEPFLENIEQLIEGSTRDEEEVHFITPGGETRIWRVQKSLVQCPESRRLISCVATDITAQQRAIATLTEEKAIAVAANNAKSEFVETVVHEMCTPMNSIIGLSHLLTKKLEGQEQLFLAETIHRSADALMLIINDILDFSKIEAGQLKLDTVGYNLNDVVCGVIDLLMPEAAGKKLMLGGLIAPEISAYQIGDPGRLRQILINLVNNAIKFTHTGYVTITVEPSKDANWLRVRVIDSGIGITEESLPDLFERFTQVGGTNHRRHSGSGLGLAICKQLVELMDGRIGCDNSADVGTTFWFELPNRTDAQANVNEIVPTKRTILLVSPPDEYSYVITQQLVYWGMELTVAESDGQAIDRLSDAHKAGKPYDFIIIDDPIIRSGGALSVLLPSQRPAGAKHYVLLQNVYLAAMDATMFDATLENPFSQHILEALLQNGPDVAAVRSREPTPKKVTSLTASTKKDQKFRILLADDNNLNRELIKNFLERQDHHVDLANDGMKVIEKIQSAPYDIILMDTQMPEMDGIAATKVIKTLSAPLCNIPIVALTDNSARSLGNDLRDSGMVDVVTKPISPETLSSKITIWAPIGRAMMDATDQPTINNISADTPAGVVQAEPNARPSDINHEALFSDQPNTIIGSVDPSSAPDDIPNHDSEPNALKDFDASFDAAQVEVIEPKFKEEQTTTPDPDQSDIKQENVFEDCPDESTVITDTSAGSDQMPERDYNVTAPETDKKLDGEHMEASTNEPKKDYAEASHTPFHKPVETPQRITRDNDLRRAARQMNELEMSVHDLAVFVNRESDAGMLTVESNRPISPTTEVEVAVAGIYDIIDDPNTFNRGTLAQRVKGKKPAPIGSKTTPVDQPTLETNVSPVFNETEQEQVITDPLFDDLAAHGIEWSPLINRLAIDDMINNLGLNECRGLLNVFMNSADHLLNSLGKARDDNDMNALESHAQSYKTAADNIGLRALSEVARHIEDAAKFDNLEVALELLDLIAPLKMISIDAYAAAYPILMGGD